MAARDYKKIIKSLRYCGNFAEREGCDESCEYFDDMDCPKRIMTDAADAFEEILRTRTDELNAAYRQGYDAAMPKRGEWIEDTTTYAGPGLSNYKCSLCGKICGTWRSGLKPSELPNWCGNCGADMRKMEVQE